MRKLLGKRLLLSALGGYKSVFPNTSLSGRLAAEVSASCELWDFLHPEYRRGVGEVIVERLIVPVQAMITVEDLTAG